MEITKLERHIYETYLLDIKKHAVTWNQPSIPNRLKQMAKDIVKEVKNDIKKTD